MNARGNVNASEFFVAGGTLRPDSPSYVERPTDDELFDLILAGEFCYVLTPRQMGKSSLMIRTAWRLQKHGITTAIIDLTRIGTDVDAERWYLSILTQLKRKLVLAIDPLAWWEARAALGTVQRFTDFLRDVVLTEVEGKVVVFVDEIDTTLNLPFRADFFAAVRAMYNARADDPEFQRLTFVLLGVASPPDLIGDNALTPFNIGYGLTLQEFSRDDAAVLRDGLEAVHPGQGSVLFDRIYYWTGGHPYLTQKLCLAVAEETVGHACSVTVGATEVATTDVGHACSVTVGATEVATTDVGHACSVTDERVDAVVWRIFLSEEARKETNLQFVQDKILTRPDRARLLALYRRVVRGKEVADDVQSMLQNQLKLSGLVKAQDGHLCVRNEIYRQVFDRKWIQAHMPVDWPRRIAVLSTVLVLVLAGAVFLSLRLWGAQTVEAQARTATENFREVPDAAVRLISLANLFQLEGYQAQARALFYEEMTLEEQVALFAQVDPQKVGARRLVAVVQGLYTALEDDEGGNATMQAMAAALRALDDPAARTLAAEVEQWQRGRGYAAQGAYQRAVVAYDAAISLNGRNPRIYYERALAYAALGEVDRALADLEDVLRLDPAWQEQVRQVAIGDDRLLAALLGERETYPELGKLAPTPVALQGGDVLRWDEDGSRMRYVPGADGDPGRVRPFWIDEHEVTNAQFAQFVQETGYQTYVEKLGKGWSWTPGEIRWLPGWDWQHPHGPGSSIQELDLHPVVLVNWNDAQRYCQWADKRLPTDAEWELAAMGTDGRQYPWGDQEPGGAYLNYCDVRCEWGKVADDDGFATTAPVCQFPPGVSPYGLCDAGGNVWEWVDDWYEAGRKRVIRGGAWSHPASDARASFRVGHEPDGALDVLGFRCACDADFEVVERGGVMVPLGR